MSKPATLVIEFDSAALRDDFRGWLSDGGGEYNFMCGFDEREDGKFRVDFDYIGNTVTVKKVKRCAPAR